MDTNEFFFQFEISINVLVIALPASFEYLCYRSTAIIKYASSFGAGTCGDRL